MSYETRRDTLKPPLEMTLNEVLLVAEIEPEYSLLLNYVQLLIRCMESRNKVIQQTLIVRDTAETKKAHDTVRKERERKSHVPDYEPDCVIVNPEMLQASL